MFAVRAQGLSKRYRLGQVETGLSHFQRLLGMKEEREYMWALDDVTFEIQHGDAVAIVGRNGAGKSTLLKILARITEPTRGYADIVGRVGAMLEVGTGFSLELTGRENVYLNGTILGMSREEVRRKLDDIVDFAGVGKFFDTPVKRYSSGMYVRLAFAVAAHLEPEVMIVDEVLAVGDAEFQKRCLGRMDEVARGGRTVLFVSHNMQAVRRLCKHAILLENGRLIAEGDTESVVQKYLASIDDPEGGRRSFGGDNRLGDAQLQIREVTVTDERGEPSASLLSSRPIYVTIEFDLAELDPGLTVGFDLAAVDGSTVFRTYHTDLPEEDVPPLVVGRNAIRCEIPPGFLNAGRYAINLRGGIHSVRWIVHEDAVISFDVIVDHGVSLFWNTGARPGVVAPILAWEAIEPRVGESIAASVGSARGA